jgi:hypothetical protein
MPQAATSIYNNTLPDAQGVGGTGLTAGGVAGAVGGVALNTATNFLSGYLQDRALRDAANANAAATNALNNNNLQYFLQSRGATGSALLPEYALDADGNPVEPQLFDDAYSLFQSITGRSPEESDQRFRDALSGYQESISAGTQAVGDLFSGDMLRREQQSILGVNNQRRQGINASRNSRLQALSQTLDEIDKVQEQRGFRNSASGSRNLAFNALRDTNNQSATERATADLTTAAELQAASQNDFNRRLQYINEPSVQANRIAAGDNLLPAALIGNFNQASSVFDNFRIPAQYFEARGLPEIVPSFGVANEIGSTGNELGALVANYTIDGNTSKLQDYWTNVIGGNINHNGARGDSGRNRFRDWVESLTNSGVDAINNSDLNPTNQTP